MMTKLKNPINVFGFHWIFREITVDVLGVCGGWGYWCRRLLISGFHVSFKVIT